MVDDSHLFYRIGKSSPDLSNPVDMRRTKVLESL